ncbi:sugar kinase [Streptomyces alboflavus]|uniref:Sugar kinase n=1 Tax=Streptomyces alboflavus TaxID=67267 RepID=A0A1Z1WPS7_9ACTN|nr:FGGY-family carbohydrate kinase [Streptomyces alboflavus]ARX88461.1 sugar kinase [Streptomyces alboflavus]
MLSWAARTLQLEGPPQLGESAFSAPPGANGLMFLPYLSPAGERAPFLDPRARGAFWGLSLEHTPADLARAVFDGLSLVVRDSLAASRTTVTELRLCGGGANNDDWCRLIADATGVPTARSGDTELGAKGAFLTGLVLTGAESSMHGAAAKYVRMNTSWEPDPERAQFYAGLYEEFLRWRTIARDAGWTAAAPGSRTTPPGSRTAPKEPPCLTPPPVRPVTPPGCRPKPSGSGSTSAPRAPAVSPSTPRAPSSPPRPGR